MPIKCGETQDTQFFIEDNGEYKPLGYISVEELTAVPVNPTPDQEYLAYFSPEPIEFMAKITSNLRALGIFLTTGNDLYLRFPKKLRRRKRV